MPFTGDVGRELNEHYLSLAGLSRSTFYLTNTVKCRPNNNRKPQPREIESCGGCFLPMELRLAKPEIVLLMGGTAASLLRPEENDGFEIDLETHHGLAFHGNLFGRRYIIFPTYHPALGLHSTDKIRELMFDFTNLGKLLEGTGGWPEEDDYQGKEQYQLMEPGYMAGARAMGVDSESVGGKLWSVQVSRRPGEGRLIKATDREGLAEFQRWLNNPNTVSYIHNDQHDVDELREAGFWVDWGRVEDTMDWAFRLSLPQGLKPLAYRLAGMKMVSYQDVTRGPSLRKVSGWLEEASKVLPLIPEQLKTKVRYKNNPFTQVVNRWVRSISTNVKADPWKSMRTHKSTHTDDPQAVWREWLVDKIGPLPQAGLDQVPWEDALRYACRDADAGLRVARLLMGMGRDLGRVGGRGEWEGVLVQENWLGVKGKVTV